MDTENTNITINRRVFGHNGLSCEDTYMVNGNAKYQICDKTRNCLICGSKAVKYNWGEIINRVNSKHRIYKKQNTKNTQWATHTNGKRRSDTKGTRLWMHTNGYK